MVEKLIIGMLGAAVLVLLYYGMHREQEAVDPASPLDVVKIQAVLRAMNLPCDKVESYTPVGKDRDGVLSGYLARCHDGGRYIYFENPQLGKIGAASCTAESFHYAYRCPD